MEAQVEQMEAEQPAVQKLIDDTEHAQQVRTEPGGCAALVGVFNSTVRTHPAQKQKSLGRVAALR